MRKTSTKMMKMTMRLLTVAVLTLALAGCNYSIVKSPAVKSIKLGAIKNLTTEPKLQDMVTDSLVHELMKSGVRIESSAEQTLSGTIMRVAYNSRVELGGTAIQYEVELRGNFYLTSEAGTRKLRSRDEFIVLFSSADPQLERVVANREVALKSALTNLSKEIVASIVY